VVQLRGQAATNGAMVAQKATWWSRSTAGLESRHLAAVLLTSRILMDNLCFALKESLYECSTVGAVTMW